MAPDGTERLFEIRHYYSYQDVPSGWVIGKEDPSDIIAYLQFWAEKNVYEVANIDDGVFADALVKFYGYRAGKPAGIDEAELVDTYELREDRCGRWDQASAHEKYYRPGLFEFLTPLVEDYG